FNLRRDSQSSLRRVSNYPRRRNILHDSRCLVCCRCAIRPVFGGEQTLRREVTMSIATPAAQFRRTYPVPLHVQSGCHTRGVLTVQQENLERSMNSNTTRGSCNQ